MTPEEISTQSYLRRRVAAVDAFVAEALDQLKSIYSTGMSLVWEQEGPVGPAEIFEELGERGVGIFMEGHALLQFILERDPSWEPPLPTHEYVLNEDGTVTIGRKLSEIPPEEEVE